MERSLLLSSGCYRMLTQLLTNKDGQKKENRKYMPNTFRIHKFLHKNPTNFIGSSVIKNMENYVEELQNELEVSMFKMLKVWN